MSDYKKNLGKEGEDFAVKYLLSKGYEIIERNWRYSRLEVDIIARKDNKIVFFEVKTRKSAENYETLISSKKEQNLLEAAEKFLNQREIDLEVRFDVILLTKQNGKFNMEHIEGAFFPSF